MGWHNKQEIGVLLTGASAHGAWAFADDLCQALQPMGLNLRFRVYTYPHRWFFEEGDRPGKPHLPEPPPSLERPCHKSIHGSTSSPRTDYDILKINYLAVHPERVERRTANCDTVLGGMWFEPAHKRPEEAFEHLFPSPLPFWKRMLDILGASFLILPLIPLLGGVALWIKIVSPGPVFFKQMRIGRSGRPFTLWKFRTMRECADESVHEKHIRRLIQEDKPLTKLDDFKDTRILPLGNTFRRFGIDELPQLFHVLSGQMSLVGPRPDVPYSVQQYSTWQTKRLDAVPGLTGLWQTSGKNRTTFKDMVRLDIRYDRERSVWNDLKILLVTIPRIISQNIGKVSPKPAE